MKYVRVYLLIAAAIILFCFILYKWVPSLRPHLMEEDHLVEHLTALFFLGAAIGAAVGLVFVRRRVETPFFVLVMAAGLIGFLDEVSFGERALDLSMPEVKGTKVDAVHDLFYVAYQQTASALSSRGAAVLVILAVGVVGMLLLGIAAFRSDRVRPAASLVWRTPHYLLVLIGAVAIGTAMIIDLDLVYSTRLFLLEELLELNAGLALVFACVAALGQRPERNRPALSVFGR